MNPRSHTIAALLALSMLPVMATSDSQTQNTEPSSSSSYKISVGANLVLVPVVVTDKHGQHVSGLKAEDFEIQEDGKAQKISAFEEITAETTPASRPVVAANSFTNQVMAAHPKKLEIILLDLLNTPLSGQAEARRGLIEFLSRSADADTLVALLVLHRGGVSMIHNFTTDPSVLVAAIQQVRAPVASRNTPVLNTHGGDVDAEARQLRTILMGQQMAATMGAHPTPGAMVALQREDEALLDATQQDNEALLTLQCMEQIARHFAGVPGRKSLFWASTGFRFSIATLAGEGSRGATPDDWQRAMHMLQDANIAVYPVDLAGVGLKGEGDASLHGQANVSVGSIETARLNDPTMAKHLTMDTMAGMTGGRAFYNFNDSSESFRRAREDSAEYYMLGYYTKDTGKNGWRKLHVRVLSPGSQARARSGFFFMTSAVHDPESLWQTEEISALTSALESTSITINGQWNEIEPVGDQRKAHFVLSIPPGGILIDTDHENQINVDFRIVAWNSEGKKAAQIGQRMQSKLPAADMKSIEEHGIDYESVLTLPPGDYDVHIVVRDNLRGKLGSVVTHLKLE